MKNITMKKMSNSFQEMPQKEIISKGIIGLNYLTSITTSNLRKL